VGETATGARCNAGGMCSSRHVAVVHSVTTYTLGFSKRFRQSPKRQPMDVVGWVREWA